MTSSNPTHTHSPISKTSPKQPQPAVAGGEKQTHGSLEHLDRVRDLDGQKAKAAESYGASVGQKQPKTPH